MLRLLLAAVALLSRHPSVGLASPPAKPRSLVIKGRHFINPRLDPNGTRPVLLEGTNVVMKGYPWLPPVNASAETVCSDRWFSNYTCYAFTRGDAAHIKAMGWNFIRLGVVWAGAQPTNEARLDPAWVARLHAFLALAEEFGLYVVLDIHQDAVGSATCGEGVPQWFSALATPGRIGKPLRPLPLLSKTVFPPQKDGRCGTNDTEMWALHAGSEDYAIKNPCCVRYNGGGSSWAKLEFTWEAQETVHYLFRNKAGRALYARYVGLLAAAVKDYPAAIAIETMNEPPSIERDAMYATWQSCHAAARAEVPDIGVGVMDTGEAPLPIGDLGLWPSQVKWLQQTEGLFYCFHWYGPPIKNPEDAVRYASATGARWNVPVLMTEMDSCKVKVPAVAAGIGWSFWEYSNWCDQPVRPKDPKKVCPAGGCHFGACITGVNGNAWANFTCA
eukprot:g2345.t1